MACCCYAWLGCVSCSTNHDLFAEWTSDIFSHRRHSRSFWTSHLSISFPTTLPSLLTPSLSHFPFPYPCYPFASSTPTSSNSYFQPSSSNPYLPLTSLDIHFNLPTHICASLSPIPHIQSLSLNAHPIHPNTHFHFPLTISISQLSLGKPQIPALHFCPLPIFPWATLPHIPPHPFVPPPLCAPPPTVHYAMFSHKAQLREIWECVKTLQQLTPPPLCVSLSPVTPTQDNNGCFWG